MSAIFISYRRDDAPDAAGRIYDRLRSRFGEKSVFFDIDAIPYGVDYRHHIDTVVASCDVLLVIIGNHWQQTGEDGRRRLDDPGDFVRIEVESALERGIPVIPVLVERASVPLKSDLPDVLKDFAFRNAAEVRTGSSFQGQIDRLIDDIAERVEGAGSDKAASASVDAGDKDPTSSSVETAEADSSRLVEESEKIAPAEIESTISSIAGAKITSIALGAIDYFLICTESCAGTLQDDAVYIMIYDQNQTTIASTSVGSIVPQELAANLTSGLAYYVQVQGYNTGQGRYDYRLVIVD